MTTNGLLNLTCMHCNADENLILWAHGKRAICKPCHARFKKEPIRLSKRELWELKASQANGKIMGKYA